MSKIITIGQLKIITIGQLIEKLKEWPTDGTVSVCRQITPPGGDYAYNVLGIHGVAGASLDGHDSGITIEIAESAYRENDDDRKDDGLLADELLTALKEILDAGQFCVDSDDDVAAMLRFGNATDNARRVIAKAEGQ